MLCFRHIVWFESVLWKVIVWISWILKPFTLMNNFFVIENVKKMNTSKLNMHITWVKLIMIQMMPVANSSFWVWIIRIQNVSNTIWIVKIDRSWNKSAECTRFYLKCPNHHSNVNDVCLRFILDFREIGWARSNNQNPHLPLNSRAEWMWSNVEIVAFVTNEMASQRLSTPVLIMWW